VGDDAGFRRSRAHLLSGGLINVIAAFRSSLLLFYLYFVMPDFGVAMSALQLDPGSGHCLFGLSGENFRGRHRGDRKGQIEAAQTIGWLVDDHAPRGAAAGSQDRAATLRQHHDHAC